MDSYLTSLRGEIPSDLHLILDWDFIPWRYVKSRHGDCPNTPLVALLDAYRQIAEILDLASLTRTQIPPDGGRCLRCGSCCTYMRPGSVSGKTYRRWQEAGKPVARFYGRVKGRKLTSTYTCWFNSGIRLRMCPFMLINLADSRPFCIIHHMGREHRPRACSRFPPNPPTCQTGHFVAVP